MIIEGFAAEVDQNRPPKVPMPPRLDFFTWSLARARFFQIYDDEKAEEVYIQEMLLFLDQA